VSDGSTTKSMGGSSYKRSHDGILGTELRQPSKTSCGRSGPSGLICLEILSIAQVQHLAEAVAQQGRGVDRAAHMLGQDRTAQGV
jgi:hypothetical protein